jgi:hypothetical protein
VSYSPEYRELSTNDALLDQLAEQTGGKLLDLDAKKADVFRRPVRPSIQRLPIWAWLVGWFVLPLLLMDVAARRLASAVAISVGMEALALIWVLGAAGLWRSWWGWPLAILLAEGIGWAVRYRSIPAVIEALAAELRGLRSAEAAAESVSRLKTVREKVREELAERAQAQTEPPDEMPVKATARFDLGEAGQRHVGDLDKALGGARSAESEPRPSGGDKGTAEGEEKEMVTSRLLQAKRRARQQRKKE